MELEGIGRFLAGWLGKVVRYEVWLADALCLARIESNWEGGEGSMYLQ